MDSKTSVASKRAVNLLSVHQEGVRTRVSYKNYGAIKNPGALNTMVESKPWWRQNHVGGNIPVPSKTPSQIAPSTPARRQNSCGVNTPVASKIPGAVETPEVSKSKCHHNPSGLKPGWLRTLGRVNSPVQSIKNPTSKRLLTSGQGLPPPAQRG